MTMYFRPEIRALQLALAGAVVLAIGMGYGRFSYTGILPVMLKEGLLSLHQGNLAASANYAGYLIGALLLAKAKPADARRLNMASVGLTIGCLLLLAWTKSPWAVVAVRGVAGLLSAVSLIAASLWLLQHMKHHTGAPVLYTGVGLGIFLSAEFIALGKAYGYTSQQIWLLCGIAALLLFMLVYKLLLSPPDYLIDYQRQASSQLQPAAENAKATWKLLAIYGLAGFGYIITATYLPLFLSGSLSTLDPVQLWAIFGLAAIPSCFVWHQIVLKYGYRRAFAANLLVQAAGVVLPAFSHSLLFCLLSAALVGFTFTGTVTIALPEARRLAHLVRFNMIAAMTAIYGIGQIVGPLVAGELYGLTGSFNGSLAAATGALLLAGGLVLAGRSKVAG
ncbi:YbfB/YjiJ family MFS transporter [Enterobacter sp. Ap-916]|uniref:YbfB/YjiJ family MFS transporter n=1 Tax=unclassified Enterobacter TaxID=2608935 RepID=UPI001422BA57|nr:MULTISPECIES: YbfB/YjiJ family MFS transporter [unclassified Enterobacter]NIF57986.1 YbfB/YjiJ family MFS transporter [Enterobacter sp. Ap-867]NIG28072.1 YbfB/YjiJ family MFS transporter [Enterobacter sp. Ap-916]